mgnify:CR=1 FL=1
MIAGKHQHQRVAILFQGMQSAQTDARRGVFAHGFAQNILVRDFRELVRAGLPPMKDREALFEAFQKAVRAAECVIRHGCQRAMNDFNG